MKKNLTRSIVDTFGRLLEQRFIQKGIQKFFQNAGFTDIVFNIFEPRWYLVSTKILVVVTCLKS